MWNFNITWSHKKSNRDTISNNSNLFFIIFIFWKVCSRYDIAWRFIIKKISRISVVWSRSYIWNSYWCLCRFYFFICFIWSSFRNSWWWKIFFRFSICYGWKNERGTSKSRNFRIWYDWINLWVINSKYGNNWNFYNSNNEKNRFLKRKSRSYRSFIIC